MNLYNENSEDNYIFYFIFFIFLIILDRLSKHLASIFGNVFINTYFRFFCIAPIKNKYTSFSWLSLHNSYVLYSFVFFSIFMLFFIFYQLYTKYRNKEAIWGECLILAGGVGNLYDRIFYSYVIDFIYLKIPLFGCLAVYNLADIFIVFGIIYSLWQTLLKKK